MHIQDSTGTILFLLLLIYLNIYLFLNNQILHNKAFSVFFFPGISLNKETRKELYSKTLNFNKILLEKLISHEYLDIFSLIHPLHIYFT